MMTPVPVWQLWKRGGNKIDFSGDARSRKIAMKDLYCFILWGLYGSISGHTELSIFSKYIIQIEFWQVPNWTVTYTQQHSLSTKNNIQIFYIREAILLKKKTFFLRKTFTKWWPPPPVLYLWNPYSDFFTVNFAT